MTPITCHILDTVTGKPAPNIPVRLTHAGALIATAHTNADGRVLEWTTAGATDAQAVLDAVRASGAPHVPWTLSFRVDEYFHGDAFFSDIDVHFKTSTTEGREHWHVPLLLSPWSYTTYRGS